MFHDDLKRKMDAYAHFVYKLSKAFPKDEIYGVTSQLRRSALSVVLNYVEGYARQRDAVLRNFLEISYGSLKESRYLLDFSLGESYCSIEDHGSAIALSDEIGAMLWKTMKSLN